MIKLFEAFAGYGTASFALKELGVQHELVGFSEIDKYAVQCFEQNHGGKNFGDITRIDWSQVRDFDLLTGGFPCQAFSVAGKGLGHLDERGVLANYLTKALMVKKPKWFLFENVKGFMSERHKEFRETLFNDWKDCGYKVFHKVLNTRDFGIPQNRERVFIIGFRNDIAPSFGEFNFPQPFELDLKLKDVLEEKVDEKYFLSEKSIKRLINNFEGYHSKLNPEVGSCLFAGQYKIAIGMDIVSHFLFPRSSKSGKGGTGHLQKEDGTSYCLDTGNCQAVEIKVYDDYNSKVKKDSDVACTLTSQTGSSALRHGQKLIFSEPTALDLYNQKSRVDYSPCLTEPHHNSLRLGVGSQVRRLTPKECFRLQGFLDDRVNLEGLSDTQKYKLAGNGQSVNVVKLIFKQMKLEEGSVKE